MNIAYVIIASELALHYTQGWQLKLCDNFSAVASSILVRDRAADQTGEQTGDRAGDRSHRGQEWVLFLPNFSNISVCRIIGLLKSPKHHG